MFEGFNWSKRGAKPKKPTSLSFSIVMYSNPATQTAENEVSLQSGILHVDTINPALPSIWQTIPLDPRLSGWRPIRVNTNWLGIRRPVTSSVRTGAHQAAHSFSEDKVKQLDQCPCVKPKDEPRKDALPWKFCKLGSWMKCILGLCKTHYGMFRWTTLESTQEKEDTSEWVMRKASGGNLYCLRHYRKP